MTRVIGLRVSWATICFLLSVGLTSASLLVESPFGSIQGLELTAWNKLKYVAFRGIPYAKPPVGELRFARPEPHPPLNGIFDGTKETAVCPQPEGLIASETQVDIVEDCLLLNIYTKELTKNPAVRKKVLVFIHGGGFIFGGAIEYEPGTFVTEQDIILVTVNYRLGVLGFLSTGNDASQGNYGMWDQALALKWIKDNIAAFGGDQEDIAIAGESAGGMSVGLLSISPEAKGLFTKAYPMSGTASSVFAIAEDAQHHALRVAKSTGCWDGEVDKKVGLADSQAIIKCLRELPVSDITKFAGFNAVFLEFAPRVDGVFIPAHPSRLLKDDQYLESIGFFQRTYLTGIDNTETGVMQTSIDASELDIRNLSDTSDDEKDKIITQLYSRIKKFYVKTRLGLSNVPNALINKVTDWYDRRFVNTSVAEMLTDLVFLIPTFDFLDAVARSKTTDAYFIYFNHFPAYIKGRYRGTLHGIDLCYWFDFNLQVLARVYEAGIQGEYDDEDLELKTMFSSLVAEFVRSGKPGNALKDKFPGGWPAYDFQGGHYLNFAPKPSIRRHLEEEKRELWMNTIPHWVAKLENRHQHTEL